MAFPWLGNPPALLGIDITPDTVRLIQLGKRYRRRSVYYCVECYAIQPIVPSVHTKQSPAFATGQALRNALQQANIRTRRAAIAVPNTAVICKTVSLPKIASEFEMECQVLLEAEHLVSFPLADIMLDFVVLGPSATTLNQVVVLIVAARRKVVEQHVALLQAAELQCCVVDLVPDVLSRAYRNFLYTTADSEAYYVVLVLEPTSLYLALFVGSTMLDHQMHYALIDQWDMLDTLNRALNTYIETYGTLSQLWLAGPCDLNQAQQITNQTGIPVALANPFSNMALRVGIPLLSPTIQAPSMLAACSLALRRFD